MPFKSNEREFMSQVTSWLNEFLSSGTYPFDSASSEPSLKGMDNKTQFPDVQLWLNRETQQGYGWELKPPATSAEDPTLLENAVEKARTMGAAYFVTWNMRDAIIWKTPEAGNKVKADDSRRRYPSLYQISSPDDLLVQPNKIALKNRTKEILDDLATLYQRGSLHAIELDAIFFVHMLNNAVQALYPNIRDSLVDKVGGDANFKKGLWDWAVTQGIANYVDPAFYEVVSRQIVYRLLSRILFYETLRRQWTNLPKMDIADSDVIAANNKLKEIFSKAQNIDWHAVFEEDFSDKVGFPEPAIKTLDNLLRDLNNFNFSQMPQDVIGAVFEKLIPPEERHTLGQYFTPENLVDLIDTFCIRTRDALVLDPTCGTGTFLTRAYDRMKEMGQREHKKLLPQLWGIDIAHFPAQLATINLFRQDLHDFANFPRIIVSNTFKVSVGQSFSFPPPRINLDSGITTIEEKFPLFDAAVGNFPYIRQELINKQIKGHKEFLEETVKKDWLADYRDVFEISDKQYEEFKRSPDSIDYSKVGFKLSGQADIYAYLFFHVARFVKEGGRMGFVTSNSWLDVAYGYEMQKFFLNNFKLVAVLESRAEPWFEDAAINTIVTILERCSDKTEVSNHTVKFVKIKRKLSELIPWDMKIEAAQRWHGLDGLVYRIESAGKANYKVENNTLINTLSGLQTYEDNDFRIRLVKQGELQDKLLKQGKTDKWGKYLRAPEVYFEILEKCGVKLVQLGKVSKIQRGYTTGINEFFYLTEDKIKHWDIEEEFLAPVIKSPKESDSISIDPKKLGIKVFLCSKSKEALLKDNKLGALRYIEWGEKQKSDDGSFWSERPSVQGRNPGWWALREAELCQIFWSKAYDTKLLQRYSEKPLLADCRMYFVSVLGKVATKLIAASLNCSLSSLILEIMGRVSLGDGALDVMVEDAVQYMVIPDIASSTKKKKTEILEAFDKLSTRPVKPIFEEVKMKDRQKLDSLILEALGLDPGKYLQPLYDGLTELVGERIELAGMRKKGKQAKAQRSIDKVLQEVIKEVLPNGLKKFPDEFLDAPLKPEEFENISIPKEPLSLGSLFLGTQEILSGSGSIYTARNSHAAKYIIYSQKPDTFTISLPKDDIVVTKAVSNYEIYLRKIKEELYKDLSRHTLDPSLSERLVQQATKELGLPDIVLGL